MRLRCAGCHAFESLAVDVDLATLAPKAWHTRSQYWGEEELMESSCLRDESSFEIALTLLFLSTASVQAQDGPKKYALLVGVNKYDHAEMNRPYPLQYAEADVDDLAQMLRISGYEVDLVTGSKATKAEIEARLNDLPSGKRRRDRAGRGSPAMASNSSRTTKRTTVPSTPRCARWCERRTE